MTNKGTPTPMPHIWSSWVMYSFVCGVDFFRKKNDMITRKENKYDDYGILTDFGNLYESHRNCRQGKRWKDSVATYDLRALESTLYLQYLLMSEKYSIGKYHCFTVNERGKLRNIKSAKYKDRVVQKNLCDNILTPRIAPTFVYSNGASLKGKGTDFTLDCLKEDLRHHYRIHGTSGYILVCDFSGYFDSLSHELLNRAYEREFKDERIIRLIRMIHASTGGEYGVPLGNQLSQLDALIAGSPIDHMIKERLKIGGFARYNDDFYLIHESKEYLKFCLKEIGKMAEGLGLKLNAKKTKIVPVTTGINYLGFHVYLTESGKVVCRIKAKSKSHERQKLRKMKAKVDRKEITYEAVKDSYQSWKAHASRGDTYYMLQEMDCYFYGLFIDYLSDTEKARYEKLKRYNEQRQRARKKKQEVKKNGKVIK
jgi:hypothetical protein